MPEIPSRRGFLRTSCSAAALLALGWNVAGCDATEPTVDAEPPAPGDGIRIEGDTITLDLSGTKTQGLKQAGNALFIASAHTIVINAAGTLRAFTSICTHEGCDVEHFQNNRLTCFCHGSQFDTSGAVLQGPASRPLAQYAVTRDGDTVTIKQA